MSDAVEIALITSLTTGIPSILAMVFAFLGRRAALATQVTAKQTEENTNHMKDELVALTAKSSHAEGKLEAQQEAKENGG